MAPSKTPLSTVRATNEAFFASRDITAVFTGGTSGIGEYTLRALAAHYGTATISSSSSSSSAAPSLSKTTKPTLTVYLVGRNAEAAERILGDCRTLCPRGTFEFVRAVDLSLLRDVDGVCGVITEQVRKREKKEGGSAGVDLLVMTHSDFYLYDLRRETSEGLDKSMSLLCYSRLRFIVNLMPLLRAAPHKAQVVDVFGAGLEKLQDWNPADLSLRKDAYNMTSYRSRSIITKTFFLERLAVQNAGKVAFTHVFPGLVITPGFDDPTLPRWFKMAWWLLGPVATYLISTSREECCERMLYYLASPRFSARGTGAVEEARGTDGADVAEGTDGVHGSGAYSCDSSSRANALQKIYDPLRREETDELVWNHVQNAFREIEAGRVFQD